MKRNAVAYTNEKLSKRFKSNFELVNYAIHLAEDKIKAGRDTAGIQQDNLVVSIISDLAAGRDVLRPVVVAAVTKEVIIEQVPEDNGAVVERKKAKRKIIREESE